MKIPKTKSTLREAANSVNYLAARTSQSVAGAHECVTSATPKQMFSPRCG